MRSIIVALAVAALAGCGVETASTAATAGALKKQEVEQGQKTMQQMNERIGEAMTQAQQRSQQADGGR
jgi:NifU-like protein involved in Fe-S cluster formation